jgi:hypothetical protein
MSDPTLPEMLARGWALLTGHIADRPGPGGHPSLATLGPDGWPETRTVVLRGADPEAGSVEVHTDLHSAKVAGLRRDPRAQLLLWDPETALQLRLWLTVTIQSGLEVAAAWARVPDPSRQAYGTAPPPGTPIAAPFAYDKPGSGEAFAILTGRVERIDLVHLGPRHLRAAYHRADSWAGQWLAP